MKSHELMREVIQRANPKLVADALGVSVSMVYKWAEPTAGQGSGAVNPLDRVEALIQSTGDPRLAQWVCERSDGFFVPNPSVAKPRTYAVIPATNKIVQEFAGMLSVIASAALDNDINPQEAERIRGEWEGLKRVTESFVKACEEGDFQVVSGGEV